MKTGLIMVLGSGGVGKTTSSASIALALAARGLKSVVITVDPAKRLAQALGLSSLSIDPQVVYHDPQSGGEASALWLDTHTAFNDMVKRLGGSSPNVAKVLSHRLFKIIRDQLGGVEEYLGIDRVLRLIKEGQYDFCILDTPPSRHALDFLESPKHLLKFFDDGVIKYFISDEEKASRPAGGFLGKIFQSGKSQAVEIFKNFLGQNFIAELGDLLSYLKPVRESLRQSAGEIEILLRDQHSRICLVSLLEAYPLDEARLLKIELSGAALPTPHALILNKCLPSAAPDWTASTDSIGMQLKLQYENQKQIREKTLPSLRLAPVTVELHRFSTQKLDIAQLQILGREIIDQWAASDKTFFLKP